MKLKPMVIYRVNDFSYMHLTRLVSTGEKDGILHKFRRARDPHDFLYYPIESVEKLYDQN